MTAPQAAPGGRTSTGTPRGSTGAVRQTTAAQPAGSASGGDPGHRISAPGSSGASASSSTTAVTGRSSEAPAGTRRAPASAGTRARSASGVPPTGGAEVLIDRDRVVTGRSMGRWQAGFQARGGGGAGVFVHRAKDPARRLAHRHKARARAPCVQSIAARDQTRRALRAMPRLRQKNVTAAQWSSNGSIGTGDLTAPGAVDLRSQRVRPRRAARRACPRTSSASSRPRSTAGSPSTPTWPTRSPPR